MLGSSSDKFLPAAWSLSGGVKGSYRGQWLGLK